jgi:PAS domain S-box-containing protein
MRTQTTERLLLLENEELRRRLAEAEETLRALRAGEVDAVLVEAEREQVFTLESADKPYRLLVEQMPQGAATLTVEGAILYCNRRFADLLKRPLQALLGKLIHDFVAPDSRPFFEALLRNGQAGDVQGEVTLQRADGTPVPVYLGVNALQEGVLGLCLIVTDLTEQEARKKAERFADRIARLQQVTVALAEALTVDQVAEVMITHGLAALGANAGVMATLTDDGSEFVNLRVVGYPRDVAESWPGFPADAPLPMADAVRLGRPVVLGTPAERDARYPELARRKILEGDGALVALPLLVRERAIGALRLAFPTARTFSADDLAYMLNLVQQCAQALERARLYDAELRARERAEQEIKERRRAEEALRASEGRLRLALQAGRMGTWEWDIATNRVTGSPSLEAIHGLPTGTFPGTLEAYQNHIHPDDRDRVLHSIQETLAQGKEHHIEYRLVWPDGTVHWVEGQGKLFSDGHGRPIYMIGICQDITERKQAGEAVMGSEARFRNLLFALPAAVYTTDREGRITLFNDQAAELWGRRPDVGKDLWCGSWQIFRPDGTPLPHDDCPMAVALREGRSVRGQEIIVERPDGTRVCVLAHPEPLRDASEKVVGGVNMLVDITDRKRAEEARFWLAAIVESSDDAIITTSLDGTITSWNRGAEGIFGYAAGEIVGRPVTTLTAPESSDDPLRILERIRQGERVEHYETLRRTKDGQNVYVSLTVSPVRDSAGRIIGASKIARDISERKRLEEALRDRTRQLAEADRRKDEFLAMLAHELRNPLAPLRNAAQVLQMLGSDAPKVRWAADLIHRQVQQATRLVDDLLDIARIARGKVRLQKEAVELATIVARAVETSRPLVDARKHDLTVSLPAEPVRLEADPARLVQVLINLLNNAAKYTEQGGRIWLTAERKGSEVVLRVRDTGVGIPPDVLPHVFDLFTQEERSLGHSQGGLGIGLSLVRRLVEMHGGSVEATSLGVGRGSEFTVRVPALPEAQGAEAKRKQGRADGPAGQPPARRVLVVDDNRDAAESLAILLQVKGHEVQTAHEGLAALEIARDFRPDIVLLDIGLPGMDGYEVARRLRQEHGRQEVLVALTGYGTDEDHHRSREAGFDYHLAKPVELDALYQLLIRPEASMQ